MSESGHKAVFLSYASQDAEAAKRICEALRAAGVEVWFDQNELVGGDQWDVKIRGQISSCTLFVPLISSNTQARLEGYFRLEWKLAAQRTHTMADEKTFLLPVVIDATRDAEAKVPAEFKSVQWTKLPAGETPPAFCTRVQRLLGGSELEAGRPRPAERGGVAASPKKGFPFLRLALGGLAIFVAGFGAYLIFKPRRSPQEIAQLIAQAEGLGAAESAKVAKSAPPSGSAVTPPLSAARQLLAQARPLVYEFNVLRADYDTAASLLEQASKLDPNDATVWAMWAVLDARYIDDQFDYTPARKAAAKAHAARAQGLDPANRDVRFAQAYVIVRLGDYSPAVYAEAEKLLRPLLAEDPNDPRVLRNLGFAAYTQGRLEEALDFFDRAAKQPGDAAESAYCRALVLCWSRRYEEAEQALEKSIGSGDLWKGRSYQVILQSMWHGELDQAQRTLAELPLSWLMEDQGASTAAYLYLWRGETDKALDSLRQVPHEYLESRFFVGPKSAWNGDILAAGGRLDAARSEWRSALQMVEQRLAGSASDRTLLERKITLLAELDEKEEARRLLKIYQGLFGQDSLQGNFDIALLLESPERAFATIQAVMAHPPWYWSAAALRFDPQYEPLRKDPRFAALLARAEADPRLSPKARAPAVPAPFSILPSPSPRPEVDAKSVAVLAFANLSDDKANEYFSDGISEELLNVLAKVPKLKVAARTSSFSFKGQNVPVPEIAQKLGVAYVVEGSVRKAGNKVRITAQLIKAADGFHVWSETYDRELQDIFAVQDEIAKNILVAVKGSLLGEAELPHTATTNTEAYALFLRAQGQLATRSQASMLEAERLFVAALAIDPDYVPALVGLARTRFLLPAYVTMVGAKARAIGEEAKRAAQHALELDPRNAGALAAHGSVLSMADWRWAEGEAELLQARELAPNDAWVANLTGDYFMFTGNVAAALAAKRKWLELDPLSAASHWDLGFACIVARDYDQAIHWGEEALKMAPNSINPYLVIALAAGRVGQFDLMRQTLATARREVQDDQGLHLLLEAYCAILEKRTDEAHRIMAQVEPLAEKGEASPAYLGYCYLLLGESDQALVWLQRGYELRDPVLAWHMNIDFAEIAADPKTRSLLERPGLKELHEIRQRNARDAGQKP